VPGVTANAVENVLGQVDGRQTFLAADTRRAPLADAIDEMPQLAGELIVGMAVDVQGFQVPAEQLVLDPRPATGIQFGWIESVLAQLRGRLHERQPPLGEIDAGEAFRGPHLHAPERLRAGPAG